ncbi:MAG: AAA family ATPase [Acidimicrobiales bacterium]
MTLVRQRATTAHDFELAECFEAIVGNVERVIQGKDDVIRLALVCLMAEGHLLIEDVPGVGKTSLAKALALSLDCRWQRIQFTPDLLPSDVTGVTVYSRSQETFEFRPGGIFANIVLGDEINRASPKTQSALLEAMEEGQVTVDTTTYRLPAPFMVIATQNPIEHEGTYPLPESQLDRFLMRVEVGYPSRGAEVSMLEAHASARVIDGLGPVAKPEDVDAMVAATRSIYVAPGLKGYIVDLADVTRSHPDLALGMSPRSTLALLRASRAWAASQGRDYVIPDDVKAMARPVLSHRLMLSAEAQIAEGDPGRVLDDILGRLPVPAARSQG